MSKINVTISLDSDVAEACQPLMIERKLSPTINLFLRNLLLKGKATPENVVELSGEARKPLEQKRDFARTELLKNARGSRWIGDRSLRQRLYWINKCGFKDWEDLVRWVNAELVKNEL